MDRLSVQAHVAASDSHSFSQLHLTLRRERERPYPQYINSNEIKYSVPALSWPSPPQRHCHSPRGEGERGGETKSSSMQGRGIHPPQAYRQSKQALTTKWTYSFTKDMLLLLFISISSSIIYRI